MFVFLVSTLGISFAIRIFTQLAQANLFAKNELTKIGTAVFFAVFALLLLLSHTRTAAWFAIFVPIAVAVIVLLVLMQRRSKSFRSQIVESLSLMVLKMKSGKSFRSSLSEVVAESHPGVRVKLTEVASAVAFSQQTNTKASDLFVREIVSELIMVDQNPHAAIKRLSALRDRLRVEDEFRRKSGQVLARIRGQSFMMSGMYFAIFTFMVYRFGWSTNIRSLSISLFLFAIGTAWVWLGGRSLKWKV